MHSLREIQLFELEMLKDVARVCERNNINYFLSDGTMLGAIRHGGFIPWDDDIDICMPIKDYKRFLKIGQKELGDRYFVQNYRTEKYYFDMFTQVRVNGTTSIPLSWINFDIHYGMHMDIFPLVGLHDDAKKRDKQIKMFKLCKSILADKYMEVMHETPSFRLWCLHKIPRGLRKIFCRLNEKYFMLDPSEHKECTQIWYDFIDIYKSDIFEKMISVRFEDCEFKTVKKYEEYLTTQYGDWRTPPSEDQRGGHEDSFGSIVRSLDRDYKEYRQQLLADKK